MVKKVELKERDTNETMYPITSWNCIHDFPQDGKAGQILVNDGENIKWSDIDILNIVAYGVEWDITVADPHLTRIGNMNYHKSLPIQSALKGCIAQGNKIMYWLDEDDWLAKKGKTSVNFSIDFATDVTITLDGDTYIVTGTNDKATLIDTINATCNNKYIKFILYDWEWVAILTSDTAGQFKLKNVRCISNPSVPNILEVLQGGLMDIHTIQDLSRLDGYDGTVRVYCPDFYIKSEIDGNKRRVWISTTKIDDTWTKLPACLIDAYRSTILRTVPTNMGYLSTLPASSAISVTNTADYCRGGSNQSSWDKYFTGADGTTIDIFRTLLGKPATATPRSSMRIYSRNANSEMLSYDLYKNILYWLYVIEYANFNCLEAFNDMLTDEGYHQGGMGYGITTMGNWGGYNGYYPICPCGYTNELGNRTGVKNINLPAFTFTLEGVEKNQAALTLLAIRWRGFENAFGDIWTNLDGIIIDSDADNHPNNMNYVYTCLDSSKFADTITEDYKKVCEEIHLDGYTKEFDLGTDALIIPNVMGGNTTKHKCDYHYAGNKNAVLRTLVVGGLAHSGGAAGLGCFSSSNGVSDSGAGVGFRSASLFMIILGQSSN